MKCHIRIKQQVTLPLKSNLQFLKGKSPAPVRSHIPTILPQISSFFFFLSFAMSFFFPMSGAQLHAFTDFCTTDCFSNLHTTVLVT